MAVKKQNVNDRILAYLKSGWDITADQAKARFGIRRVAERISELRKAGYPIYLNEKTTKDGEKIKVYRLGTPTRFQVAAGHFFMTNPEFASYRNQIEQNLSLVG